MAGSIYLTQPAANICKPDEMTFYYIHQLYLLLPLHKIQCTNNPLWILDVEDQITGKQQGEVGIEISDAFVDDNCMERISPSSTTLLNVN